MTQLKYANSMLFFVAKCLTLFSKDSHFSHENISVILTFEPCHEKTNNLHMRKQRRRSASR